MKNIALCLRYDGSRYHGWQVQKNDITVAQTLEEALSKIATLTGGRSAEELIFNTCDITSCLLFLSIFIILLI